MHLTDSNTLKHPPPSPTIFDQQLQESRPVLLEEVGASEGAVAANHHQVSDAALDQVLCSLHPPLTFSEVLATC